MNKWLELLLGLILVVGTIVFALYRPDTWGANALIVLEGGLVWFVGLIGLLFLLLGISDLRE
jgi:hypothetical protein